MVNSDGSGLSDKYQEVLIVGILNVLLKGFGRLTIAMIMIFLVFVAAIVVAWICSWLSVMGYFQYVVDSFIRQNILVELLLGISLAVTGFAIFFQLQGWFEEFDDCIHALMTG